MEAAIFLRRILFAAPLLQAATIHEPQNSITAGPAPTSDICHVNIYLLLAQTSVALPLPFSNISTYQDTRTEGHARRTSQSFSRTLSFLRAARGPLVKLSLKEPLGTLDDQREMYTLCPSLKTFTLDFAELAFLRCHLNPSCAPPTLHNFAPLMLDGIRVFEDFCSSWARTF